MNWSLIDGDSFDCAADAWGYTYGAAIEWYEDWWTIRGGVVDMPTTPGYKYLDVRIRQLQYLLELEEQHTVFGQDGKLKLIGFLSRGELGGFNQALALAAKTGTVPDTDAVLRYRSKGGAILNLEQRITEDLGMFARAGMTDDSAGTDSFTDIGRSISAGLSLTGKRVEPACRHRWAGIGRERHLAAFQELPECWRGRVADRWRATAALGTGADCRGLLKSFGDRLGKSDRRLPIHKPSRLRD